MVSKFAKTLCRNLLQNEKENLDLSIYISYILKGQKMIVKPIDVYSIVYNMTRKLAGKKVKDINKCVHNIQYQKQPEYIRKKCNDVYIYLNSGHYNLRDIKLYLIYENLFGIKAGFNTMSSKRIIEVRKLFLKKQYVSDKEFIMSLCKKNAVSNVIELFDVGLNGISTIDDFIINKFVSPVFYVRMRKNFIFSIDNESDEHRDRRLLLEEMMEVLNVTKKSRTVEIKEL